MLEISYRGQQGMACSTLYPGPLPQPEPGRRHAGIRLMIAHAKEDFAKLGVTIGYADKSLLSATLTLEKGPGVYDVTSGFRREKTPPDWDRIAYIMLTAQAGNPEEGFYASLGRGRAAVIVINVLLPFAAARGRLNSNPELSAKAMEIYRHYPALADNALQRHMANQLGTGRYLAGTARRQQGLLHIYKTLCSQGRCRECPLNPANG